MTYNTWCPYVGRYTGRSSAINTSVNYTYDYYVYTYSNNTAGHTIRNGTQIEMNNNYTYTYISTETFTLEPTESKTLKLKRKTMELAGVYLGIYKDKDGKITGTAGTEKPDTLEELCNICVIDSKYNTTQLLFGASKYNVLTNFRYYMKQ